ncbi:MAG: hypothetical protein QXI39_09870, partial [Candidatus Bathyarchaeia archaeon]
TLSELASRLGVSLEELAASALERISRLDDAISEVKRNNPSYSLSDVLVEVYDNASHGYKFVRSVLKDLGVEKGFIASDIDSSPKEKYLWIWFSGTEENSFYIDIFDITWDENTVALGTYTNINVSEQTEKALRKLERIVEDALPPWEVESFDARIDKEEDLWRLEITCEDYEMAYLPSLKDVSKYVKRIFRRAGISYDLGGRAK